MTHHNSHNTTRTVDNETTETQYTERAVSRSNSLE